MSLFMLISGFFAYNQIYIKSIEEIVRKKSKQLLLPSLSWGIVIVGYEMLVNKINISEGYFLFIHELWFLKCLFLCFIYTSIVHTFIKESVILSFIVLFILSHLTSLYGVAHMLPSFIVGMLIFKYKSFFKRNVVIIMASTAFLYLFLLQKWNYNYGDYTFFNIYKFMASLNNQTIIYSMLFGLLKEIYRVSVGITGAIAFACAIYLVCSTTRHNGILKKISAYGTMTLGIYVVQALILERIIKSIIQFPADVNMILFNVLVVPVVSLITLYLCILIVKLLKRNKYSSLIMLGQ